MKRRFFVWFICVLLFLTMMPAAAFAEVTEVVPDKGSLPDALNSKNAAAVKKALAGDFGDCGVIVDMKTFNAVIVENAGEDLYYNMPDIENRILIGFYENPNADTKTAVEKDSRSFEFYPEKGAFKGSYGQYLALDLNNLKLPERAEWEFDAILDRALFVREPGFSDINGHVCSACGTYVPEGEEGKHIVLSCGMHMGCYEDKNDMRHFSTCYSCGRAKCTCYCNNYIPNGMCIVVAGSGEYAVAGSFRENVTFAFDKDAKIEYIDKDQKLTTEIAPTVECVVCGRKLNLAAAVSFNCACHYACPGCIGKLSEKEMDSHQVGLECGHFACDGRKHSTEIYSENCPYEIKHHKCEGYEPIHQCDACGKEYTCEEYPEHKICWICGRRECTGSHGNGICGFA